MLTILFTIIHVLVSLFLILVILAQQGKGQDLASAFGGTGSQTAFGARGTATLLSKITAGAAALFMVTSLTLSYLRPAVANESVIPNTPAPTSAPVLDPSENAEPAAEPSESEAEPPAESEGEAGGGAAEPSEGESEPPPQ